MVSLYDGGIYLVNGTEIVPEAEAAKVKALTGKDADKESARKGTIAYSILEQHNVSGDMEHLKLRFDAMASHDITFVGIVQTAKASGMEKFPIPYVLTNCHNTLCAVGGTINEDDHMFGLSAAKKYGGIYVPPHIAVIHQYMREMMAGCGKMILGSDSHTRYGALGTMAVGEGGGELVKQLLRDTYDVAYPGVVAIYLTGQPMPGVGPQDIALAIIGAVFKNGYVKNKVMEFVGPGVASMSTDYRNGVDVMTTETTCLSSIWRTDEDTESYLSLHGRGDDYKKLDPADVAYYDGCVYVDLSTVKPMIALPFHPSNTYEIDELNANLGDILRQVEKEGEKVGGGRASFTLTDKIVNGKLLVQQGIIAGCAGGNYTNVIEAAHALKGRSCGCDEFSLAVYPSSQPVFGGVYKLAAVEDKNGKIIPKIKISENVAKITTPCFKSVWRLFDKETDKAIADVITLHDEVIDDEKPYVLFDPEHTWKRKTVDNFTAVPLLQPIFQNGECVYTPRALKAIKAYCLAQVDSLWEEVTRFENPHNYYVDLSQKLWDEKNRMLSEKAY